MCVGNYWNPEGDFGRTPFLVFGLPGIQAKKTTNLGTSPGGRPIARGATNGMVKHAVWTPTWSLVEHLRSKPSPQTTASGTAGFQPKLGKESVRRIALKGNQKESF